jgi:protein-disulfide isomerase
MIIKKNSGYRIRSSSDFSERIFILFILAVFTLTTLLLAKNTFAEGITKEQGDAILDELKGISKRLGRIEKQGLAARRRGLPQRPTTTSVSTQGNPIFGAPNAPITLVEFTDYQCPFCKRFVKDTLPELKKNYIDTGKLRLVLRDLPRSFHKLAKPAARAAHCAGEQNKYWLLHDAMFKVPKLSTEEHIFSAAEEASLDMSAFKQCFESDRYNKEIDKDVADASKAQINGTPGFVLGKTTPDVIQGTLISGVMPYSYFDAEIKKLLK